MWAHPAVIIGAGVVGAIIAIVAVGRARYNAWEEQQQQRNRPASMSREPEAPRVIGTCGSCEGNVTNLSGYALPCDHHIHYTCAAAISRQFKGIKFSWSDVCQECIRARIRAQRNSGLRRRSNLVSNRQECSQCLREFASGDDITGLKCGHRIHEQCWLRLQENGLTTCSLCMDDAM